jgi:predicted restriction endonuclease
MGWRYTLGLGSPLGVRGSTQAMSVQDFLTRLATIKRAPWQGDKAPHKPVLLLAVADWFEENGPTAALVPCLRQFAKNLTPLHS